VSDNPPSAAKLEKQLRVLERKLERSEWHRVDLENQHDRDQHLYRRLQADLEAAKREAEIEAALERLRARTMAMRSSDELADTASLLYALYRGLGYTPWRFIILHIDSEEQTGTVWLTDAEGQVVPIGTPIPLAEEPHFAGVLAAFQEGAPSHSITLQGESRVAWTEYLTRQLGLPIPEAEEGATSDEELRAAPAIINLAYFSHGALMVHTTEPISEEQQGVLQRFARVVGMTYQRFLDLKQAEEQARDAERQAALDRVRAAVASTLTGDAHLTEGTFELLEAEIRTLFGSTRLRVGLASIQTDGELNVRSGRRIWNSLVIRDALREGALDWRGTLYETAMQGEDALAVSDVESDGSLDEGLREILLAQGVRSLALQPLRTADRTVGLFELSSHEAGAVDDSTLLTMRRLESTFALAVTQNLEGFETRVESAIQHAYTAIHPSVRWRFRDAAIRMLERSDDTVEPEPVVFEGVHALYGAADIRASTHHRNEAVRHDVLGRLGRARDALAAVHVALPLTILDELGLRVRKRIEQYERAWNAGDEAAADRFLTEDVEPVLERMTAGRADLVSILEAYRPPDEEGGALRSDAYEASRRAINRAVSDVLLAEEAETQRLFPHYLELTRTDGVEHTMYIGPSIAPDRPFDPAYVENLRLRQLIATCAVARAVRRLGETLPMPLAIAQLVVVQHAPVTLRFRADEKRFDVDSPSGVRFELLKKRLDKACVKGTEERITQPDQIAVVYSTEDEGAEYRRYAEYLSEQGHIEAEFETLEVEELPGAAGLRMLRLKVSSGAP
jgi:hypothetical protein